MNLTGDPQAVMRAKPETAVRLGKGLEDGREYWGFRNEIYVTDEIDLTPEDVRALLLEKENRKRVKLPEVEIIGLRRADVLIVPIGGKELQQLLDDADRLDECLAEMVIAATIS